MRSTVEIRETPTSWPPSNEYRRVCALPKSELERILWRGQTPDPEALVGWEFRGTNPQWFMKYLGIRKFIKGFYRLADTHDLYGYNIPVVQDATDQPWVARPSNDQPKRFGFYRVAPPDAASRDNAYLNGLLLDYGAGPNPVYEPARFLRDYLVRVERGSDDLLLGKAYVALGPARVATSFFLLERHRPTSFSGSV
jgi:hypothetical protein